MSFARALGVPVTELHQGELVAHVPLADLPLLAERAASRLDARLATLFATDERAERGVFTLHHVWSIPGTFLRLEADVDPAEGRFPSIAACHPAANWFEREVMDYFGLVPEGHPHPHRVALHDDWPEGAWCLRRDFPADAQVLSAPGDRHPFRPVTGEGVFQIPVGPVHAGIIEPGHFRFGVAGEPVLYLQLRLFYTHKGIEKRFEGLPWRRGLVLAESISGDTAVGHALAYMRALERLCGVVPPPRAVRLRVVLLELERLYNHVSDIGAIATDVAFAVPASRAQVLREELLRVFEDVFGHRMLRGTVTAGGVRVDVDSAAVRRVLAALETFSAGFHDLMRVLDEASTFGDRIEGTGVLKTAVARDLAAEGPAARASGVDVDSRRDHPADEGAPLEFEVAVEESGDVRARVAVRAREVAQSLRLVRSALGDLPAGPLASALPTVLPANASALGWSEGWRGMCLHWVQTGADGVVARVKVTDPSSKNWPALAHAVPGNIVPDFPVINKSFNLSYSGNDR